MKFFALVNDGLEPTAALEIKEKININPLVEKNVLEFISDNQLNLQSVRRLLVAVTRTKDLLNLDFHNLDAGLFTNNTRFKILIEGVSGQENRLNAAKIVAEKLFRFLHPVNPVLDLKQPKLLVIAFYNGTEYFVGIDNSIREANNRSYRVFPHSA